MHNCVRIADDLFYLGGNDRRIALFESAYPVPRGVSYNSYLLTDEKTVLFDTVDLSVSDLFFENLAYALGGRALDYIVVHHMEPDHSATFARVLEKYPSATVVTNQKVAQMLKNYFGFAGEVRLVKEGDTLSVGKRTLSFVFAPMVHWPEVMFTYIPEDGTLFSADAFGTFGALPGSVFADEVDFERDFLDDARRYYFNIVGKYGVQVQNVLKKAAGLEIKLVCPLHGPVWRKNFAWYLQKYLTWSAYEPEEKLRTHAERGGDRRFRHCAGGRKGKVLRRLRHARERADRGGVPLLARRFRFYNVQQRRICKYGEFPQRPESAQLPEQEVRACGERVVGAAGGKPDGRLPLRGQEHGKDRRKSHCAFRRQRRERTIAPRARQAHRRGYAKIK